MKPCFFIFLQKKSASPDAEKNPALANGIFIIKKQNTRILLQMRVFPAAP